MSKKKVTIEIDENDKIFVVNEKRKKPIPIPLAGDFDTGISCPPIPEGACPANYDAYCSGGTVWCKFSEGEG